MKDRSLMSLLFGWKSDSCRAAFVLPALSWPFLKRISLPLSGMAFVFRMNR
jgi:hypothetical protein